MVSARREAPGQRKSAAKYEAILRAAIKVFAGSGFFNSKVADVAREAGVADGTVYLYFKNKDDILASIFNQYMDEALSAGRTRLAEIHDPIEKLRQIVHAHLEGLGRDRLGLLLRHLHCRERRHCRDQLLLGGPPEGRLQPHEVVLDSRRGQAYVPAAL